MQNIDTYISAKQLTLMVALMMFRSGGGAGAEPQTEIGLMFGLAYR